jgi:hypothetical protein
MYFKLNIFQEKELLEQPETGMGYQVVKAFRAGSYNLEEFLILNSEVVIETNLSLNEDIRFVINQGTDFIKAHARTISLRSISVLNEKLFRNIISESDRVDEKGALENPVIKANGTEVFVRLSAFSNDRRVDKIHRCLLPGSFTTTEEDYFHCKAQKYDPIERYALPNNDEIKHAFHIKPLNTDTLQMGKVQPANGKNGGGKEVYFAMGTATGTFIEQTAY